jgi:TonB family protein
MLRERFTNRWNQPMSVVRTGRDLITTVKIRISKDGTITSRELVNSSGNSVVDDSVMEAAQKVVAVDPLPNGLGGEFYEVKIDFKLDQGQ